MEENEFDVIVCKMAAILFWNLCSFIVPWEMWLWFQMCKFQTQHEDWYFEYSSKNQPGVRFGAIRQQAIT